MTETDVPARKRAALADRLLAGEPVRVPAGDIGLAVAAAVFEYLLAEGCRDALVRIRDRDRDRAGVGLG